MNLRRAYAEIDIVTRFRRYAAPIHHRKIQVPAFVFGTGCHTDVGRSLCASVTGSPDFAAAGQSGNIASSGPSLHQYEPGITNFIPLPPSNGVVLTSYLSR